jgi:hypothetical protein
MTATVAPEAMPASVPETNLAPAPPPSALVVRFGSTPTYFSSCQLQVLGLRPTITHARDQGIEVGAGELPLEWLRDALEVALEVCQPLGYRLQAGEVVRRQRLALHDREVDFDLVEPARVDGAVNRNQPWMRLRQAPYRRLAAMRRAVIHDPEHAARGVVRWLTHDLIDQALERRDAGG